MKYSTKQFAEANEVSYPVAYGFLRFLAEKELVQTNKVKGGRGPGTVFFEIPENLVIKAPISEVRVGSPTDGVSSPEPEPSPAFSQI